MGDYDRGLALFDKVLEKLPGDPANLTSKGHALKTTGASAEAIASYRAAIAARPDHGDAWYALANLKTYRFSDDRSWRRCRRRPRAAIWRFMDRVHSRLRARQGARGSRGITPPALPPMTKATG